MEIEFLGTGAGVPAKSRNVTSIALKLLAERNEVWLFDVGEGTQQQILSTAIRPRKITKIFITHLHGDHIFGLPGLLSSRSFQGGEGPLTIYGPAGIEDFVKVSLRVTDTHLGYQIKYVTVKPGVVLSDETFVVTALPLSHRIESFGYRIVERDYQGELQVAKIEALGIRPGPVYGQLKAGKKVTLEDGQIIDGNDFIGTPKKGRIVTILGDTRKNPNIETLALDADVLVHESTFGEGEAKLAYQYYHSTNIQAATVAKTAGVKRLFLTHISARYLGKGAMELQNDARKIFPNTVVVKDFDLFDIPFRQKDEVN